MFSAIKQVPRLGASCRRPLAGGMRFKSASASVTAADEAHNSGGCPFTGTKQAKQEPKLTKVPTLPFFGSMLHQYSGTPKFDPTSLYTYERTMRAKFGEFYSSGFPGFGNGLHGIVHTITNPNEMLKVIRAEGAYPSGIVNSSWTFKQALNDDKSAMLDGDDMGLLGVGERWKTQRTFLQTGMLDPRAAKAFVPGIVTAAEIASQAAPTAAAQDKLNYYLNLCAFDMFSSFMFGELTMCASLAFKEQTGKNNSADAECDATSQENMEFCKAAIAAMETSSAMGRTPSENIAHNVFGYKTKQYRYFEENWAIVRKIGMKKLIGFIDRYHAGDLNELERNSYMFNAMERLEKDGENAEVSQEEVLEICLFAMFVGVDTTSGVTSWNLMHIALNPRVQQKLYEELSEAAKVTSDNGHLTAKTFGKRQTPYLNAILRENYRLTPPFGASAFKRASQSDVKIHGTTLPKNSMVMVKNKFNDTVYLEDALEFKPERWMPDQVAARAGTDLEEMDHALFRDSFGQGARRCPASRVATNEVLSMIAQLVLDYEIRPPAHIKTLDDVKYSMSALVTPTIPQLEFIPRNVEDQGQQSNAPIAA
jgi:cytochrome P450